jgi:hypothetical protein
VKQILCRVFLILVGSLWLNVAQVKAQQTTGVPGSPDATRTVDGRYLPNPQPAFDGIINLNAAQSKQAWPARVVPPKGAPNILLIMTDDVGFAAPSTFGGVIPTPALDRIASNGLRYTNFHSTALCSPTRAALITGRNHHSVGFGVISEAASGYPGYNSIIGNDNATIDWYRRRRSRRSTRSPFPSAIAQRGSTVQRSGGAGSRSAETLQCLGYQSDLSAHGGSVGMGVRHAVPVAEADSGLLRRDAPGYGDLVAWPH